MTAPDDGESSGAGREPGTPGSDPSGPESDPDAIDDADVVRAAASAAEDVVFSRFDSSELSDVDVTVTFEDGVLEVDVYLDAEGSADPDRVADDAALAARAAVDDLLE